MNNQNTTLHIRLWNRDFWLMAVANLLLTVSVTILIPTLPMWMEMVNGLSSRETGYAMGSFALGVFLPGALCSFLVQHYRRNKVCVWAVLALAVTIAIPFYVERISALGFVVLRLLQGAAFGLAQMVLVSTLIIDTCESANRTEANFALTWFGRFALSLGPIGGLLLYPTLGYGIMALVAVGCLAVCGVLILTVHCPFRVPSDHLHLFSLDRFLLLPSWPLFLTLLTYMVAVGLVLSLRHDIQFFAFLMVGFLLALLAQRYAFRDAELKSEVVSGLLLSGMSVLVMLFAPQSPLYSPLLGLGIGLVASRLLLFFIKFSHHCQRGTAQSTFLLGWESGLSLGIGLGFMVFDDNHEALLVCAALLMVVALTFYSLYVHAWFLKHKNR